MRLVVQPALWNDLGLDNPRNYHIALSCFYLGKGVYETRDLIGRDPEDRELMYLIESAALSGLDESKDVLIKGGLSGSD